MTAHSLARSPVSAGLSPAAITTSHLTKRFGNRVAVRDLTIEVPAGRIIGFVGPNGAGKTTTLRLLLGLIRPSFGDAHVLGRPISDPASYLDRVGALIETPAFYPTLSGRDNLRVLATLGNIDRGRVPGLLKTVGLQGRERDLVGGYSLGMKQRLGVAAALLPDPDLLVLDEPANGLDPEGIIEMRELLRTLHADGKTIFVSSHLLGELEQVADWLVVIRDGEAIYTGSTRDLTNRQSDGYLVATLDPAALRTLQQLTDKLGLPSVLENGYLRVTATRDDLGRLNQEAAKMDIPLAEMRPVQATLEQTFLDMIGGGSDA